MSNFTKAWTSVCRRFLVDRKAAVLPIFVVSMVPVFGLVGAAVDYARVNQVRTSLQIALDAAVIAGAHDGSTSWSSTAQNSFGSNFKVNGISAATEFFALDANRAYTGTA